MRLLKKRYEIGGELLRKSIAARIGGKNTHPFEAMIELNLMLYSLHEASKMICVKPRILKRKIKSSGQFCKIAGCYFLTKNDIQDAKILIYKSIYTIEKGTIYIIALNT